MGNAWIEALKEYNKGHQKWCVVKKGTPEYNEVKKIMEKKQGKTPKEPNKMYKDAKSVMPNSCLLYTSPSPRDRQKSRMPSSA